MQTPQHFVYQALAESSIRLFKLATDRDQPSTDAHAVGGHLEHVLLQEAPPFLGLSYCWGTKEADTLLSCNGGTVLVTKSLANAVHSLQTLCGSTHQDGRLYFNSRYIWIDQLCINQNDSDERSQQVKMMGQIYARASRTVVWLGDETPGACGAWHLIDRIYNVFSEHHEQTDSLTDIKLEAYSDARHSDFGLPSWGEAAWAELHDLMSLHWFSRTWVIQEVVLSQRDPILVHGNQLHSFDRLGLVASWLRRKGYLRRPTISNAFKNVDTISNIRRSHQKWPIDVLVMSTSAKFRATDQRDKIFGLLGMAAETLDPTTCPRALEADYNLDTAQVYQRFAVYLFEARRSLVALTRCVPSPDPASQSQECSANPSPIPTWVPNWSDLAEGEQVKSGDLIWIEYSSGGEAPTMGFPDHYQAGKGLQMQSWTVSGGRLSVRGLRVDTIVDVSVFDPDVSALGTVVGTGHLKRPARQQLGGESEEDEASPKRRRISLSKNPPGDSSDATLNGITSEPATQDDANITPQSHSTMSPIWQMALLHRKYSQSARDFCSAFIRTATADQSKLGGVPPNQMLRDGAAYLAAEGMLDGSIDISDDTRSYLTESAAEGGDAGRFNQISRTYLTKRAFFVTAEGRFGIGPSPARRGDMVYIVPGGEVPYIISSQRSTSRDDGKRLSRFVGESWIDGLMSGAAIELWRRGQLRDETLTIV